MFQSLIDTIVYHAQNVKQTRQTLDRAVFTAKDQFKRERLVLEKHGNGASAKVFAVLHVLNEHAAQLPIPSASGVHKRRLSSMIVHMLDGEYDCVTIVSRRVGDNYNTIRFDMGSTRFPHTTALRLANALDMVVVIDE
jgi:DNA relaxase NicK